MVYNAVNVGAAWVAIGRNIFQAKNPNLLGEKALHQRSPWIYSRGC
jgi:DhnA family fructose-bisphosphate aldolase class Ia